MIHFCALLSIIYKCPLGILKNRLPAICRDFYAFGFTILTHWGAQHQMERKLCQHDDSSQNKGEWKRTAEQHTQGTSVIPALTEMKGCPYVVGGSSCAACWGTSPRGCLRQWRQKSGVQSKWCVLKMKPAILACSNIIRGNLTGMQLEISL